MTEQKKKRPFLRGCLLGFVLGAILPAAALILGVWLFRAPLTSMMGKMQAKQLRVPPITSGLEADYAWQVQDLDGQSLDMETLRGRTVFLNFWRPGCVTCLAEIPAINALHERLGEEIAFVCIAVGDTKNLHFTVEEERITFPVYTAPNRKPTVFDFTATPATFIIAPNGDVVFKHLGGAKWDDESAVEFLRGLADRE